MRTNRKTLLCLAALGTLTLASTAVFAQKFDGRGGGPATGGGYHGRGGGFGIGVPGIIMGLPAIAPRGGGRVIEDGSNDDHPRRAARPRRTQRSAQRGQSGAPPAGERRFVPDEVVIEVTNSVSAGEIAALQRRHRLTRLESQVSQLSGATLFRWRIPDRRSVASVVRALEADRAVTAAQPNYLFTLQQNEAKHAGDPAQYELAKLHLTEAHGLTEGDGVRVAVIDSGIDAAHPDLKDSVVERFDTLKAPTAPHKHGTAVAGLIAAHGRLVGAAPRAAILAIRAFDPSGTSAEGTTFNILKGLDWAATHGARVINMSFAGPSDPAIHRSLAAAHKKSIVLVAAAGNAGPKSPPLYPAADPDVIAVSATDADNHLFEQSNRGAITSRWRRRARRCSSPFRTAATRFPPAHPIRPPK